MGKNKSKNEQHPYFPSGAWEGFYLYGGGPAAGRHPMNFQLSFKDGIITGSGTDDVGAFGWNGEYDVASMAVTMVKQYRSHQVLYRGMADESGIYGSWAMVTMKGGFHIWPKKKEEESAKKAEVKQKKKKLAGVS